MDKMPPIGSPEFFEACAEADKHIYGEKYDKYVKPRRASSTLNKPAKGYPSSMQVRALNLMVNEKKRPKETASILYKETGIYITYSTVKNWLFHYRKQGAKK